MTFPGEHTVHVSKPGVSVYVPGVQSVQAVFIVACWLSVSFFPDGHGVHAILTAGAKCPD